MRALVVIAPPVGAAFMILFALTDRTRDLSRQAWSRTQNNGRSVHIASQERGVTISTETRTA
jgi:hypothetical protein